MRVIAQRTLKEFWLRHADAEQPLKAWYREAQAARWSSPHAIMERYRSASLVGRSRVVFNIAGDKYRLVVRFNFDFGIAYIRFVGKHSEYDRIDVEVI